METANKKEDTPSPQENQNTASSSSVSPTTHQQSHPNNNNEVGKEHEEADGFQYPSNMRRKQKQMNNKKVKAILNRNGSFNYANYIPAPPVNSEPVPVSIPKESLSILIGTSGRNICLVVKQSHVFIQSHEDGRVLIFPRNPESDTALAQRMITSIVAGGVIRWFTHPSSTHKYYHVSARPQLQELVSSMTQNTCSLQLLRAHSGHLCLFVMPEQNEVDTALITSLRPVLLSKISELSACNDDSLFVPPPAQAEVVI